MGEWEVQTTGCKAQECIVQHREYSQYFVITVNGKYPLKLYDILISIKFKTYCVEVLLILIYHWTLPGHMVKCR